MNHPVGCLALALAGLGVSGTGCYGGAIDGAIVAASAGEGTTVTAACAVAEDAPDPAPEITAVSRTAGPAAGAELCLVHGRGFQAGASVTLDDAPASPVRVVSPETILVGPPAGMAGRVVVVTNPDGQSATHYGVLRSLAARDAGRR